MKILVIEDEKRLSDSIVEYLDGEHYRCEQSFTFADAAERVAVYNYDCILLDLVFPGGNGLDILRRIRDCGNPAGVIIVSARDSVDDKVHGLEIGADDYLAKPFSLAELGMRIYAVIRRRQFGASNVVESCGVRVSLPDKAVTVGGMPVQLTKSEYDLLLFLIGNRNRVVSKSAMAEHLTGDMADMMDSHDFLFSSFFDSKMAIV